MEFWKWQKQQQEKSGGADSKIGDNKGQHKKSDYKNNSYYKGEINQNRKEYHENKEQGQRQKGYVGAPYNFISFYDKVYEYPKDKLTAHNSMEENLLTGEIAYEITAETPIMIGDGDKEKDKDSRLSEHFYKDAKGRYAIPGSTMRGLIRNNVQVLGLCNYDDDIDDYALMYRKVTGKKADELFARYKYVLGAEQISIDNGENHSQISVLLNVRAGYLLNEGGKYVIFQTKVDSVKKEFRKMNYYVLSERKIIKDYLKYGDESSYAFFCQDGKNILQHEFKDFVYEKDQNGRVHYRDDHNRNKDYKPYCKPISYDIAHEKDVIAVGKPGEYKKEGYAVSTGKMNEKKAVYIIPAIDKNKERIVIPQEDVRAFQIDLKKKENTLKQFGGKEYFDLPKEGKMRPVFYIHLNGRLYFGFTPRLRLFYDHMLKDGLKQRKKEDGVLIDYNKALFGYATPKKSYKSKLSFSDAVLKTDAKIETEQKLILAEPKPTSYLDYLKQNKNTPVTYNTDGFELRGVKQYWLHERLVPVEGTVKNEKASSVIRPLNKETKFVGKIRFQNLTEDELGLLLWAVRLNEGSQMNIGKAKAYGYGRISVKIREAKKLDMQRAYKTEDTLCMNPFEDINIDDAIACYKKQINQYLGKRTIDELPHIQDFFRMKNVIPPDDQTRYMKIDAREYQSRKKPLPTIRSVVEQNQK